VSTITDDLMEEYLLELGFTEKEAKLYLVLLEIGMQPASVLAKKTGFPKATIHFLCDNLVKKGYLRRSQKGRTQYFYAEPGDLEQAKEKELKSGQEALEKIIPLLKECKNPYTSPPKVTFFEGVDGCKKAYLTVLDSKTDVLEFAAHDDLTKMGGKFMNDFIDERSKRKLHLDAICPENETHKKYKKKNKKHCRRTCMFPKKKGEFFSSIDVFDDKVLLLNLYQDAFAILIQNKEFADTMKTIYRLAWENPDNMK
jgi:HTH-type transcriptional regulator, sugar sensing transcriptional regulator